MSRRLNQIKMTRVTDDMLGVYGQNGGRIKQEVMRISPSSRSMFPRATPMESGVKPPHSKVASRQEEDRKDTFLYSGVFRNGKTSSSEEASAKIIRSRSTPSAMPAEGGIPASSAARNASSGG